MPYDQSTFGTLLYGIPGVGIPLMNQHRIVLGGGIRGYMPSSIITSNNDAEFETNRVILKEVWNNGWTKIAHTDKFPCTPFRQKLNCGDVLSRNNYTCGGTCQAPQSIPNVHGIKTQIGSIQSICDKSRIPPSACNVKYVYDSSNYTTFLKQKAINKTFNDLSYGGDNYNSTQSAIKRIRSN